MEARVFSVPVSLHTMNKGEERLGGCDCQLRGTHQHPTITLTVFCLNEQEPIILQVRDCMTVLQLKYLIEKKTGLGAEQQMLYSGGRVSVPLVTTKKLRDYHLEREDVIVVERGLMGGWCVCFIPCPPPCCKKKKDKPKDNYYPN